MSLANELLEGYNVCLQQYDPAVEFAEIKRLTRFLEQVAEMEDESERIDYLLAFKKAFRTLRNFSIRIV